MFGGLSAKERLAQLQQKSAKDSGPAKPGSTSKTSAANGKTPAAKTETAKLGAKDTAQAKEEANKQEPVKPKEEPKKVEPVKPKEEPKKLEPVKPKEEPKKPEPVKPKEEPKKVEPVKPKEEPKKVEPVKPKEEPKKLEPVKPKEEPKKPEPAKPKEEPKKPEPAKPKEEPKKLEPVKPKEEPKLPEPVKPKEEPKKPEPAKITEEPKKVEPAKPKEEEPKKPEPVRPAEAPKQPEPPKPVAEVKQPEPAKSETEPKRPEAAKPVAEPQKPEPNKSVEAPKKLEPETPKIEPKKTESVKPAETPKTQETKQPEAKEPNKPREIQNPPAQQAPPPATIAAAAPAAGPNRPQEAVKPKEATANISSAVEAKPVEPGKAVQPSVTREEAKKAETPVQPAKPAEVPRKPEEKPVLPVASQGTIKVESVAPASNAAPIKVEQVQQVVAASTPQVTDPPKPKQAEFRAAEDDFYANIFYFSGMGSLIGSALASGVYVPENTQRNAIEAEEVEQARSRHDARRGNEIIVTARQQAQGLSADFRQLQSLLESLPTFTDAPGSKPYDRRALDEPIHGHVYFSHEQRPHQQQQQQQQQQRGGQTQPEPVVSAQTVKPSYPVVQGGGIASYLNQEAFQNDSTIGQRDASNQYPFGSRDGGSTTSQRHFQPSHDPDRHGSSSRLNGAPAVSGVGGGGILDSIDQFDRAFAADAATVSAASRAFGSSSGSASVHPPPPSQSNRYETTTTTTIRHYENAADHGGARDSAAHQGGRPTSSPRPYADQGSSGGGVVGGVGGGSVDATGIKPWQLSHLRSLEAKGYNIVAESEKSFASTPSHYGSDRNRGSGVRSPYQQEVIEYTPVVAVTAKPTGSINHPYAASLEMPYCDL